MAKAAKSSDRDRLTRRRNATDKNMPGGAVKKMLGAIKRGTKSAPSANRGEMTSPKKRAKPPRGEMTAPPKRTNPMAGPRPASKPVKSAAKKTVKAAKKAVKAAAQTVKKAVKKTGTRKLTRPLSQRARDSQLNQGRKRK